MPRFVALVAALAILFAGVSSAWASARMLPAASPPAAAHAHCHEMETSAPAVANDCCKNCASCEQMCNASAAVPMQANDLDDYISAHFESLQAAPALFPAHALSRFKPPIAPLS
jgi:hypothetical protein